MASTVGNAMILTMWKMDIFLFQVVRFRADSARCAFLEGAGMRLELIEVKLNQVNRS